jgi:hypothetical protein
MVNGQVVPVTIQWKVVTAEGMTKEGVAVVIFPATADGTKQMGERGIEQVKEFLEGIFMKPRRIECEATRYYPSMSEGIASLVMTHS